MAEQHSASIARAVQSAGFRLDQVLMLGGQLDAAELATLHRFAPPREPP
jgi:hypothetical protein